MTGRRQDEDVSCGIDVTIRGIVHRVLIGTELPVGGAVFDDRSMLHIPGSSGLAGTYQSIEIIVGLIQRLMDATDSTLCFRASRVVGGGNGTIVVMGHTTAAASGRRLDTDAVHILSISAGAIRDLWVFHTNQADVDDFWST